MHTQKPAHGPEQSLMERIETLEATVADLEASLSAKYHLIVALLAQRDLDVYGALRGLKETFDKLSISDAYDVAVKQEIDRAIGHAQKLANANRPRH